MAAFEATEGNAIQSSDGKTITFSDTSPYGTSDEGYTTADFSPREVILTDYLGNALATLLFGAGELTVDYAVTTNLWINYKIKLTGVGAVPDCTSTTKREGFNRIFQLSFLSAAKSLNGCCASKTVISNICQATTLNTGAEFARPIGDATGWTFNTNGAQAYIDLV